MSPLYPENLAITKICIYGTFGECRVGKCELKKYLLVTVTSCHTQFLNRFFIYPNSILKFGLSKSNSNCNQSLDNTDNNNLTTFISAKKIMKSMSSMSMNGKFNPLKNFRHC